MFADRCKCKYKFAFIVFFFKHITACIETKQLDCMREARTSVLNNNNNNNMNLPIFCEYSSFVLSLEIIYCKLQMIFGMCNSYFMLKILFTFNNNVQCTEFYSGEQRSIIIVYIVIFFLIFNLFKIIIYWTQVFVLNRWMRNIMALC